MLAVRLTGADPKNVGFYATLGSTHGCESVRCRVGRGNAGILPPLLPDKRELRWHASALAIRRADGKDQIPLAEKRPVSGKDRVARVVDARCFGGSAVQLDNLKVFPRAQI